MPMSNRLMRFKPFVSLMMSLAVTTASFTPAHVAAQGVVRGPISQQGSTSTTISGSVQLSDRTAPSTDVNLRLRKLDTNTIVSRTVSSTDGTFSFPVTEPGMYVVEAVDASGQTVLAVSGALNVTTAPVTTTLMIPAAAAAGSFFTSTAFLVVAAAGAAGIAVAVSQSGDDGSNAPNQQPLGAVASPER